jgi:protocatechuate 3,4-dioxygenase, beta subunit
MKTNTLNRRSLLKNSLLSSAALFAANAASTSCLSPTPEETEGPFYPIFDHQDKDTDLTFIKGHSQHAKGEKIKIKGRILDANCRPIKGATVEIWQACASGKYSHPADINPAVLDKNFQYWGIATTNDKGEYQFKTIKPGAYAATNTWTRPPHIHFKVSLRGFEELTTQMYFKDEQFNATDRILQSHNQQDQNRLIVPFEGESILQGQFDLTLKAIN